MSLLFDTIQCKTCQKPLTLVEDDIICTKCGTVYEQKPIDISYDYDKKEDGRGGRSGPSYDPKFGLPETIIGMPYVGNTQGGASYVEKLQAKRLRQTDKRLKTDTVGIGANMDIQKISAKLGLRSQTTDLARQIFNLCRAKKLLKGRDSKIFAVGCAYTACKIQNIPRTVKDFCKDMNASKQELIAMHHLISKNINFEQKFLEPESCITRISDRIPISLKTESIAKAILQKYPNRLGKNPIILMAAAIYLAAQDREEISQKKLALATGCSEVAIGLRVRDMKKHIKKYHRQDSGE